MKKFNMKKTTAAAVAAAVGAALLLGGAGTLAYWSDTADSDAQIISSGILDVDLEEGTWVHAGTSTPVGSIVPGDTVETTMNVPVSLIGENLAADLTVTKAEDSNTFTSAVTVATSFDGTPGTSKRLTSADMDLTGAGEVEVVVTVTFPDGGVKDVSNMDKDMSFELAYELKQVAQA